MFLAFAGLVHWERWVAYRGRETVAEFFAYAALILVAVVGLWLLFRRHPWRPWMLAALGFAILLQFAGGLGVVGGGRLYDLELWGVRFDKLVHFVNAFIAARLTAEVLRFESIALGRLHGLLIVLIVLGGGAVIELAEYAVLRAIPDAGVGFYHNTMRDLVANLLGSIASILVLPTRGAKPSSGLTTPGGGP
jgi:hypothetical protein